MGIAGSHRTVGNHQNGLPLGIDLIKNRQDLLAGIGIKGAGRLIGQQQRWLRNQGPGNRDPLLLAPRNFLGIAIQQFLQAQLFR